jgi:glycosyltransferase involved in cell wall biosynthesis
MPTLSIALATYNGQRYLRAQLKSLVDQSVRPSELIVADDGSSDHSLAIVREFSAQAPFPVRVIENPARLGYRANFIQATAACSGDLIAFCDQDDVWHRDKIAKVVDAFDDTDVVLVFHDAQLVDEAGRMIARLFGGRSKTFAPLSMRPWKIVPGLVQTFRRSLLRFAPLHELSADPFARAEKMSHDIWYPFWASTLGKIGYISDILVDYRQHGGNVSGWPHTWLSDFVRENIANAEIYAAANVIISQNRMELLQRGTDLADPADRPKLQAAIEFYRALHPLNEGRASIYRERSFAARASRLLSLLTRGAYTSGGNCSLGLDALLLDTFVGVPSSRLGRDTSEPASR